MFGEMDVEQFAIERGVVAQDVEDRFFEGLAVGAFALGQDAAEGDVEELAAGDFVEVMFFVFARGNFGEGGDLVGRGRDVIALAIGVEAADAVGGDFGEEVFVFAADGAEGFEVAGSGGFYVKEIAAEAADDWVDAEFIGAAVDADFVRAVRFGDFDVLGQAVFEGLQFAFEVDAFFELANEARGEADYVWNFAAL